MTGMYSHDRLPVTMFAGGKDVMLKPLQRSAFCDDTGSGAWLSIVIVIVVIQIEMIDAYNFLKYGI